MPNPEEYRRARRLIDIMLRVANQPRRWTRGALAELYELSEKQLDKDVQSLRHGLRMPLRHAPEGYYFDGLTTLPSLALSLPEALSLLLAARLGLQMPGVSRSDLAAAIGRVEALLPSELLPLVGTLTRLGVRRPQAPLSQDGSPPAAATLRELQIAVAERCRLRLLYRSASHGRKPSERDVDPYTLLPYLKSWYLVAYCHRRRDVRMFKVDRIERMARTGDNFEFPQDFDLAAYLGATWGLLRGEAGEPEDVVLDFGPEAGRWVRDEEWHPGQEVRDLAGGGVRITFQVGVTAELRRWVLGFGRQVRVVEPPSLAEWVRDEARAVGEREGDG